MNMLDEFTTPDFSVLICTRNRPDILKKSLISISHSSLLPNSVIIVATGEDILGTLETFRTQLNIQYYHLEGFGQIHQKMFGISKIPIETYWVLFLDEDLEIEPHCVSNLFKTLERDANPESIVGIGLADKSFKHSKKAQQFGLSRYRAGKVLKNAKNVNYMHLNEPVDTDWLNGASMWRKDVLFNYSFEHTHTRYAACEDLIFSFQAKKYGRLIFSPTSTYQEIGKSNHEISAAQLRSLAFWKYYFISKNSEFSKSLFLLSFTLTTAKYLLKTRKISDKVYAIETLTLLTKSIILKVNATKRLQDLGL